MYEYYHQEDIPSLADSHKIALQTCEKVTTLVYRFRTKDNGFIRLQSEWKSFKNPWTKDVEYLIAKNTVILYITSNLVKSEDFTLKLKFLSITEMIIEIIVQEEILDQKAVHMFLEILIFSTKVTYLFEKKFANSI